MYHIKTDKRNQISCELIYQALVKLTLQGSYEHLSVKTLVETAGVGRATFYRSFDTLDDVLKYQTNRVTQELSEWIYAELRSRPNFAEDEIFALFFTYWFDHKELLMTLIKAKRYWLLEGSFDNLFRTRLLFIKELLNLDDDAWPYFIGIRTAILTRMLAEWAEREKNESPQELVRILLKSFNHVTVHLDPSS